MAEGGTQGDILIACSFGYLIPDYVIDSFGPNCFVIHPSLLPLHRGSSPISAALLAGDETTGVSVVGISKGQFDAGKIYMQNSIKIDPDWKYPELWGELFKQSRIILRKFLLNFEEKL